MGFAQALVGNLLVVAIACLAIVCSMVSYRVARVLSSMAIGQVVKQEEKNLSKLQVFARRGLVGRILGLISLLLTSAANLIVHVLQTVISVTYFFLPVIVLSVALALVQTRWGSTMYAIDSLGAGGTLGVLSFVRTIIILPLALISQIALFLAPLYNIVVYVLIHLPFDILLWSIRGSGGDAYLMGNGLLDLLYACKEAVLAFVAFAAANTIDCSATVSSLQQQCSLDASGSSIWCTTAATQPLYAAVAFQCLHPSKRYLDLNASHALAQRGALQVVQAVGAVDDTFGMVLSGLLYPLADWDTWRAVEAFMNSILGFALVSPTSAMARCSLALQMQPTNARLSMCMLDISFAFDYMVDGLRLLAGVLNRWLNMAYALLLHGKDAPCPDSMDMAAVFDDAIWKTLVGSNQTVVVRMTDTQFAVSDGSSVMYVDHALQVTRRYSVAAWPFSIDPSFGVAVVAMPAGYVDSVGLMGCSCSDTPAQGLVLNCTVLGQSATSWSFNPAFEVPTSASFLTCRRARVVVQSIRWPEQRVSVQGMGKSANCIASGTCLAADAAVYVIPICGGTGANVLACFPDSAFALSNCFPYCMGLHLVGDTWTRPVVLRGAASWSSGILLTQRSLNILYNGVLGTSNSTVVSSCAWSGVVQQRASSFPETTTQLTAAIQNFNTTDEFAFVTACSTWLMNKTTVATYQSSQNSINAIYTKQDGVRVVLGGQPLVVAAGVTMRLFQNADNTYSVDFPQLVGDQFNEFTMEVGRADGIPCSPPSPVPSMLLQSQVKGSLTVPPLDVDRSKWYNPATLSAGGLMWYAVNPNYDWAEQFFAYCSHTQLFTSLPLSIVSNYAPVSIWKVHYRQADMCISTPSGSRVCSPDITQGTPLNPARALRFLGTSQGYLDPRMCTDGSTFDLWVESMESFDDLNIAVSVRRGSVGTIQRLYLGLPTGDFGNTATYFVNTQNMSLVQEGAPWLLPTKTPKVIIGTTQLCPALQGLPDIGTFVMESLSSAVLLFKMPIVLLFNPFAIVEALRARGSMCADNTLATSLLHNCGEPMFSLVDFYASVDKANTAFWSIWSFLAYLVTSRPGGAQFEARAQGAVVYLQSSRTASLMPVVYVADSFNVAALDQVLGGRRLLQWQMAAGRMAARGAVKANNALMSSFMNILSSAFSMFMEMLGSVTNIASMQVSKGADFGVIIAAQDPTHMLGEWCVAPVMKWSQFTYQFVISVILDMVAAPLQQKPLSWTILTIRFYEAKDDFVKHVVASTTAQCSGLRLIFGAGTGLGDAIYYNCLSAVAMGSALYDALRVFSVEVPLFRCTCVTADGQDFSTVRDRCQEYIAPSLRFSYQSMLDGVANYDNNINSMGACVQYGDALKTNALSMFDDWYVSSEASANVVGSFLQDLFVPSGGNMQCAAGPNNPWAVVLMPVPNDHFYVCGQTTGCRKRCSTEFDAFQARFDYVTRAGRSNNAKEALAFPVSVESSLFNPYASVTSPGSLGSGQMLALARPGSGHVMCQGCGSGADCVVLLTAPWAFDPSIWKAVTVAGYCVPPPSSLNSFIFAAPSSPVALQAPSLLSQSVLGNLGATGVTMTFVDFTREASPAMYVLLGFHVKTMTTKTAGGSYVDKTVHALYIAPCESPTQPQLLVSTDIIRESILTKDMLRFLLGTSTTATVFVKSCDILTVVEVATNEKGKVVVFLAIGFELDTTDGSALPADMPNAVTHAIRVWCDPATAAASCVSGTRFFVPCLSCMNPMSTSKTMAKGNSADAIGCRLGLSLALHLGDTGVLAYNASNSVYLHIPSADATEAGAAMQVRKWYIYPDGSNTSLLEPNQNCLVQRTTANKAVLGSWTYSQAFSVPTIQRAVRSTQITAVESTGDNAAAAKETWRLYQSTQYTAGSVQWLSELRVQMRPSCGVVLRSSTVAQSTAYMSTNCTPLSCGACTDPQTKILCAGVQNCIMSRCVGSPAEMNNVLCAVGGLVSSSYHQMSASWLAIYQFMVEMGMLFAQGASAGETSLPQSIMLRFPTDQFYDMACKYKDLSASFTGLCVSLVNSISEWASTGYATLQISSQISASQAQNIVQLKALADFIYNLLVSWTLFPILAVHRWLMCLFGGSAISGSGMGSSMLSVQLGDLSMDSSWGTCAPSGCLSTGLFGGSGQQCVSDSVDSFTNFIYALNSGIGETLLYLLILGWNSAIDVALSAVWGIQGILYAYNLKDCKVPDYTQVQALSCSCGDLPYYIPLSRAAAAAPDLWCVGSLDVQLMDTTTAIVYNPYSMNTLDRALAPTLHCMRTMSVAYDACVSIRVPAVDVLYQQGVHPLAVWSKCKSNYFSKHWDTGSGALFMQESPPSTATALLLQSQKNAANAWAKTCNGTVLQCMDAINCLSDPALLHLSYADCMPKYYLYLTAYGSSAESYFQYEPQSARTAELTPDACVAFSGFASQGTPDLRQAALNCLLDPAVLDITTTGSVGACELIPGMWTSDMALKIPVTVQHGRLMPSKDYGYTAIKDSISGAFTQFQSEFTVDAKFLKEAVFSADGDQLHDTLDCVFLGPYAESRFLPCDAEGVLECPTYWRSDDGTRNFSQCSTDALYNDLDLPYTCGSQLRRSIIKYFYRNFSSSLSGVGLQNLTVQMLQAQIDQLKRDWTDASNFGCRNKATGKCDVASCSLLDNYYEPCLNMDDFYISAQNAMILVDAWTTELERYYQFVMQDTRAWTTYYAASAAPGQPPAPAQWKADSASAAAAAANLLFSPDAAVLTHDMDEVYNMPTDSKASDSQRLMGSAWALCMGGLAQPWSTMPTVADGSRPLGWQAIQGVDWTNLTLVKEMVQTLVQEAMDKSPLFWHKNRRHAPSPSAVCAQETAQSYAPAAQINIGGVFVKLQGADGPTTTLTTPHDETLHHRGFSWGRIGTRTCVCAEEDATNPDSCLFAASLICPLLPNITACSPLLNACSSKTYSYSKQNSVFECIRAMGAGVRCPELAPSDAWGLFPADCDGQPCEAVNAWASGKASVLMPGWRFLMEGRSGLWLPNYRHVNETYHQAINYGAAQRPSVSYQQTFCPALADTARDANTEEQTFEAINDIVATLFPATQLLVESAAVASCTRFVVETARATALSAVSAPSSIDAITQADRWRRKCGARVQHLALCQRQGVFFDIKPPSRSVLQPVLTQACGEDVSLLNIGDRMPDGSDAVYITPWCVIVDRLDRLMYDGNRCSALFSSISNGERFSVGVTTLAQLRALDCALKPQPLSLLASLDNIPASGSTRFINDAPLQQQVQLAEADLSIDVTLAVVQQWSQGGETSTAGQTISGILDWWPADDVPMPTGYHVTSPMVPDELAPVVFDSHYAFDPDAHQLLYTHSSLRNATLLPKALGAGGLCRAHAVGMPMFDCNTNRVCTRSPSEGWGSPHLPVETHSRFYNVLGKQYGDFDAQLLDKLFDAEQCSSDSSSVPWAPDLQADPLSGVVGGIPRLSGLFDVDSSGGITYSAANGGVYPPAQGRSGLSSAFPDAWGASCDPLWSATPSCSFSGGKDTCPAGTQCLPLKGWDRNADGTISSNNNNGNGICFSTLALAKQKLNCFRSDHCFDGDVCLADGSCSPLHFHMWNPSTNEEDVEFSVLADSCAMPDGWDSQTLKGASPWEQVPDVLTAHGMCSHHDWASYRSAMQRQLCQPLDSRDGNDGEMQDPQPRTCNAANMAWPWIYMDFNRTQMLDSNARNMSQENFLRLKAHTCDMAYLHSALSSNATRLQVCTGYMGREAGDYYATYPLSDGGTWEHAVLEYPGALNVSHWMRTTDAKDPSLVHVAAFRQARAGPYDVRLGFLGATTMQAQSEPILQDMGMPGDPSVVFSRCIDRIQCTMPPYTVAGVPRTRLATLGTAGNMSEASLRRCGSTGVLVSSSSTGYGLCRLDHLLFPLFTHALWTFNQGLTDPELVNGVSRGCRALWPASIYLSSIIYVDDSSILNPAEDNLLQTRMSAAPAGSLFCSKNANIGCLYAARETGVLSSAQRGDAVVSVARVLNRFALDAATRVLARYQDVGFLTTYEDIALCGSNIMLFMQRTQAPVAALYAQPQRLPQLPGLYTALLLSLYEFPPQWLFHSMQATLLSQMPGGSDVQPVDTGGMDSVPVSNLLWDSGDTLCDDLRLRDKPVLYSLVCAKMQPMYTTDTGTVATASQLSAVVTDKVLQVMQAGIFGNSAAGQDDNVVCSTSAGWNCFSIPPGSYRDKCMHAMLTAYNKTSCDATAFAQDFPVCDTSSQWFTFAAGQVFQISQMPGGSVFAGFLAKLRASVVSAARGAFKAVDYISGAWKDTLQIMSDGMYALPIARTQQITLNAYTQAAARTVDAWLSETCLDSIAAAANSICVTDDDVLQAQKQGQPCFFPADAQYVDVKRYLPASNPPSAEVVLIDNGLTITLKVCDQCVSSDPKSKCMGLTEQGSTALYTYQSSTCSISYVSAPPGVQVRAFAGSGSARKSCTWAPAAGGQSMQDDKEAWWPLQRPPGYSSDNPYSGVQQNFGTDFVLDQQGIDSKVWKSDGCGSVTTVCEVQFRLEKTASTAGKCSVAGTMPPCPGSLRAFQVTKDMPNRGIDGVLYRCDACTPITQSAVSNAYIGCRFQNYNSANSLGVEALQQTLAFLTQPTSLASILPADMDSVYRMYTNVDSSQKRLYNNTPGVSINEHLAAWGTNGYWPAFERYDPVSLLQIEQSIWNFAAERPALLVTMVCADSHVMEPKCTAEFDQRRQAIGRFVQSQYREADGVWLQTVAPNQGVAWRSNAAHSQTGRFTVMHAETGRSRYGDGKEVLVDWLFGNAPCSDLSSGNINSRICVQRQAGGNLYAVHPWVGGDFNPFVGSARGGFDMCPWSDASSTAGLTMCPCKCQPLLTCQSNDNSTQEFPVDDSCGAQQTSAVPLFITRDNSDLCNMARYLSTRAQAKCTHRQGLLGGTADADIQAEYSLDDLNNFLHSEAGADVPRERIYDEEMLSGTAVLWGGGTLPEASLSALYGFLRMPRSALHPAHVAFGFDEQVNNGGTLLVRGLRLLADDYDFGPLDPTWVLKLKADWDKDRQLAQKMYPQLAPAFNKASDWSCPIRVAVFLGGADKDFAPLTPNPISSHALYGMGGVHPLIKTRSLASDIMPYTTTNGYCFYPAGEAGVTWPVAQTDSSACSLVGSINALNSNQWALSSVEELFGKRCVDIMDAPNTWNTLRSGEKVSPATAKACGLLGRVNPFVMRVRGDAGRVSAIPGLTTSSEGGDCHMGRAAIIKKGSSSDLRGRRCALVSKNSTHATAACSGSSAKVLQRAVPLSIQQLLLKTGSPTYRDNAQPPPVFHGAAETDTSAQEVSFGQLYAASLAEMLGSDLIRHCSSADGCTLASAPWGGGKQFMNAYATGTLANGPSAPDPRLLLSSINNRVVLQNQRLQQDMEAWRGNWTWSFMNWSMPAASGNFSRGEWLADRGKTCVASLRRFLQQSVIRDASKNVSRISLCNPPPTHALAILCTSLVRQRESIVERNCQMTGGCVGDRTMFYLPYQWITTNNEYAGSTVTHFYEYITTKLYPSAVASFASMCPSSGSVLNLTSISVQVAARCPATPLNTLKTMCNSVRTIGNDVLQMGYDLGMMLLSILAMPFSANDPSTFATLSQLMMSYFEQFIKIFTTDLMPLLEQVVYMILQTSDVGRAIAKVLQALCVFFSNLMSEWLQIIWCIFLRPAIQGILSIIQEFAQLARDTNTAKNVASISQALGFNDDISTCQSKFKPMGCNFFDQSVAANASLFLPQATPTICWSNEMGGSALAGYTSLLTCTASDTCALQPLYATSAQLVYCGSCPAIIDPSVNLQASGYQCDVYLRQCTCGAPTREPQPCTHTSDCVQQETQCSISDSMSTWTNSFITTPCSTCSSLNKQPVCVLTSQAATGYCTCANVQQKLLTCSADSVGSMVHVATDKQSTALCMVALDSSIAASVHKVAAQAAVYTMPFSQFVVSPCIAGLYLNLCLNVQMPYTVSQSSSVSSFVVLYSTGASKSRRLLSVSAPDPQHNRRELLTTAAVEVLQASTFDNMGCNSTMSRFLVYGHNNTQLRQDAKWCLQWHAFASLALEERAVGSSNSSVELATQLLMQPGWMWDALRENHYTRFSTEIPAAFYSMFSSLFHKYHRNLDQKQQISTHNHNLTHNHSHDRRKLLQFELQQRPQSIPGINLTYAVQWDIVMHNPFATLVSLSSTTGEYYKRQAYLAPPATCKDEGWLACANFKFPNVTVVENTPLLMRLADFILVLPTLGGGGSSVLEALISDMPYNTTVSEDYVTGARILHDITYCNYTTLTLGPAKNRNILAVCVVSAVIVYLLAIFCCPSALTVPLLMTTLFPIMVLWGTYTLSPLCFPMLPPTLFRDIYVEVEKLLPSAVMLPNTFVRSGCTSNGTLLADGLFHEECFVRCTDPPFLMTSWQDTTAWWMCELDTRMCKAVAEWVHVLPFLKDFVSSSYYYADVIQFGVVDDQFTGAHRLCAMFTAYNVGLLVIMIALVLLLLPYVLITVIEVLTAVSVFLVEAQAVDAVDD